MFDQWPQAQKSYLGPMLEFHAITTRFCGDIARENVKVLNELVLCHSEHLKQLSQAEKLQDMAQINADLATKTSEPLNEYAQHMIDMMLENASNYSKWLEQGIQTATETGAKVAQEGQHLAKEGLREAKHLQQKHMGHK
jgi:hypothetical protein